MKTSEEILKEATESWNKNLSNLNEEEKVFKERFRDSYILGWLKQEYDSLYNTIPRITLGIQVKKKKIN